MDSSFWFEKLWISVVYIEGPQVIIFRKKCIYFLTEKVGFVIANSDDLDENGRYLSKLIDSGKTFVDISVSTQRICIGFEADSPENGNNVSIFSDFRTKIWSKSY